MAGTRTTPDDRSRSHGWQVELWAESVDSDARERVDSVYVASLDEVPAVIDGGIDVIEDAACWYWVRANPVRPAHLAVADAEQSRMICDSDRGTLVSVVSKRTRELTVWVDTQSVQTGVGT